MLRKYFGFIALGVMFSASSAFALEDAAMICDNGGTIVAPEKLSSILGLTQSLLSESASGRLSGSLMKIEAESKSCDEYIRRVANYLDKVYVVLQETDRVLDSDRLSQEAR